MCFALGEGGWGCLYVGRPMLATPRNFLGRPCGKAAPWDVLCVCRLGVCPEYCVRVVGESMVWPYPVHLVTNSSWCACWTGKPYVLTTHCSTDQGEWGSVRVCVIQSDVLHVCVLWGRGELGRRQEWVQPQPGTVVGVLIVNAGCV